MAEQLRQIRQPEIQQLPPKVEPSALGEAMLVLELDRWGVSYLSRHDVGPASPRDRPLSPQVLIPALVQQPNARLRHALISLLLARPDLWRAVELARGAMPRPAQLRLMVFYSAAMLLQEIHRAELQAQQGSRWQMLPDLYAEALGLQRHDSASKRLKGLARIHGELSGQAVNWDGSYRQAAAHLLHQWELSRRWNR